MHIGLSKVSWFASCVARARPSTHLHLIIGTYVTYWNEGLRKSA